MYTLACNHLSQNCAIHWQNWFKIKKSARNGDCSFTQSKQGQKDCFSLWTSKKMHMYPNSILQLQYISFIPTSVEWNKILTSWLLLQTFTLTHMLKIMFSTNILACLSFCERRAHEQRTTQNKLSDIPLISTTTTNSLF